MRAFALAACIALLLATHTYADTSVVVPPNAANQEGQDWNFYPLGGIEGIDRYQQIYRQGTLADIRGQLITAIAFRVDGFTLSTEGGVHTIPDLNIRMSTTTDHRPDSLSNTFSENIGDDELVVYDGPYTLPFLEGFQTPNPFDFVIPLQTPFLYDGGNLVVDFLNLMPYDTDHGFPLDAVSQAGDSISRVYRYNGNVYNDTTGIVTQFTAIPVPEPSSVLLLAAPLLCAFRRSRS